MKRGVLSVLQLILGFLIIYLIDTFFFKILSLFDFYPKGAIKTICIFIKYLITCSIIFALYYRNIKSGQNKMHRGTFNNIIYCIACFLFLVFITILLHQVLNYIGNPRNISVGYYFKNYFNHIFDLDLVLQISIDCFFIPFLLCVMFPLGFSNIIKNTALATFLSGLIYGIIYAIPLHASFEVALFHALTPAIIVMVLTYLYKINQNIVYVIITYSIYVLFGIFAINYIT